MIYKASLPTLELGRLRAIVSEIYKAVDWLSPTLTYICNHFKVRTSQ